MKIKFQKSEASIEVCISLLWLVAIVLLKMSNGLHIQEQNSLIPNLIEVQSPADTSQCVLTPGWLTLDENYAGLSVPDEYSPVAPKQKSPVTGPAE